MFRHEGPSRSARKNALLAAYLACVAGFVNAGGFVMLGSFTSHVTGSVGRMGNDLATGDLPAAAFALMLVLSFFVGAFLASLILATSFRAKTTAYGAALLVEAAALAAFLVFSTGQSDAGARALDLQAAILCFAMGLQNSLVTRLSGAVIRTTHLTGVLTDLGIEAAHWLQWAYQCWGKPAHSSRAVGISRPAPVKALLLSTVVSSFVLGGIAGAHATLHTHGGPMIAPALAVLAASVYAFLSPSKA